MFRPYYSLINIVILFLIYMHITFLVIAFVLNLLYVTFIDHCSKFMYSMHDVFCTIRICMFAYFVSNLMNL